jgi:hypothetical protein
MSYLSIDFISISESDVDCKHFLSERCMQLRISLPVTELFSLAVLIIAVAIGVAAWDQAVPTGGPPPIMANDVQVIGDKLYTGGRHQATWQPGQFGQPGQWKSEPLPDR